MLNLRTLFLAGSILLATPGLAAGGFYALQALNAWQAAQTAAHAVAAVGSLMRASTGVMVERGQVLDAAAAGAPDSEFLKSAILVTDKSLADAEFALASASLPGKAAAQARTNLPEIREKIRLAIGKARSTRGSVDQYNRTVEQLEHDILRAERTITLAEPSVGVIVDLARTASEVRGVAGRRGLLLNGWFRGESLGPTQRDELVALTGQLYNTLTKLDSGVETSGLADDLVHRVNRLSQGFLTDREPYNREMVRVASTGGAPLSSYAEYRAWAILALDSLVPLREILLSEAALRSAAAIKGAKHDLVAAVMTNLVSLALIFGAVAMLLRNLVDPARAMTLRMTALASGDLTGADPARSRLREINAMVAAVAVFRDNIANLKQRDFELSELNQQFTAALDNMSQGLAMFDGKGRLVVLNRQCCSVLGIPPECLSLGTSYQDFAGLFAEENLSGGPCDEQAYLDEGSCIQNHKSNLTTLLLPKMRQVAKHTTPLAGGGWLTTYEDITERRKAEAEIEYMAHHDALTGLPNRIRFHQAIAAVLEQVRNGEHMALLCLDLDGFKNVNDTLGHPAGDELLRAVAQRLRNNIRATDLVARLGGDEFAIIYAGFNDPSGVMLLAERLVTELGAVFEVYGQKVQIGTSVGIAVARSSSTPDELLREADIALYRAKTDGRGRWQLFEQGLTERLQRHRELELDLGNALAEQQFEIQYQPLVKAQSREVTCFETLLRWRHPVYGLIPPQEFIPIAEQAGLIKSIGAWVLRQACSDAVKWPAQIAVAVNLSSLQFQEYHLIDDVQNALATSGLLADRLDLEITESVLLRESDNTVGIINLLRQSGVRFSLDDFGTGYSSLSYLLRFSFDKLKIDQSFIRGINAGKSSKEIIRAVVQLGKALDMKVVAEGVETPEQAAILQGEGCDELQGYLFSRPMPVHDVRSYIAINEPKLLRNCASVLEPTDER